MPSEMVFIAVTETIPITMQVVVNIARVLLVPIEARALLNPSIKLAIKRFIPLYQVLVPVIVKIKDAFWHDTERADRPLMRRSRRAVPPLHLLRRTVQFIPFWPPLL